MMCWRKDLQRQFVAYVDGELPASAVERIESHLLDCGVCRDRVHQVREGRMLAIQIPRAEVASDPWHAIEAALDAAPKPARGAPARTPLRLLKVSWATAGWALAAVAVVANIVLLVGQQRGQAADRERLLDAETVEVDEFHPVRIDDIADNTEARIVVEGYVSDVRINPMDDDVMFRVVDDLQQNGPFIVCEVIPPFQLAPPPVGSRVRVYGVSRYDAKEQCQWHEIHPVLKVEILNDGRSVRAALVGH